MHFLYIRWILDKEYDRLIDCLSEFFMKILWTLARILLLHIIGC